MDGPDERYIYSQFTQGPSGYYGGDTRTALTVVPVGVQCVLSLSLNVDGRS